MQQLFAMQQQAFLSTLSLRRATIYRFQILLRCRNFYPRSPCGERPGGCWLPDHAWWISIHALLAESDQQTAPIIWVQGISIHALLAESDSRSGCRPAQRGYFYPRSPCGERRRAALEQQRAAEISIHALLAESDCPVIAVITEAQSISIHALLAESDSTAFA